MDIKFTRERLRFHTGKKNVLVLQGWIEDDREGAEEFEAFLDGQRLPVERKTARGPEVTKKYLRYKTNVSVEYFLQISLPETYPQAKSLRVFRQQTGQTLCHLSGKALARLARQLPSWMEHLQKAPDGSYVLRGWYLSGEKTTCMLLDGKGRCIPSALQLGSRMDILGDYPEAEPDQVHGFELVFDPPGENFLRLVLRSRSQRALYVVDCKKMLSGRDGLLNLAKKSWNYWQRKGTRQLIRRVSDALLGTDSISYEHWRKKYGTTSQQLEQQRAQCPQEGIRFSILVPLYKTPESFLKALVASVQAQTWKHWELILSDGSGADSPLKDLLAEISAADKRIRVIDPQRQMRISENTNTAMTAAGGDYLIFGDHDDLLTPDALFECARYLENHPKIQLLYTDEDKTDETGKHFFEPHFKSDYNPELLCSMNYFCHMVAVKRELAEQIGGLRQEYDGAQDYDFVLRCTEQLKEEEIGHIPKILYHWRAHSASTAENPESKRYAFEAGKRAVQAHYDRKGIAAAVSEGEYPGLYRTEFPIVGEPLISILIPNKDHSADLQKCIASVEKSDYPHFEYIIIENNSTEPETFSYYEHLEKENPRAHVVYYQQEGGFNYASLNNFGASYANGSYLLLLNNDTEMMDPDTLRQLLGYCQQEGVGICGARLFYEDGSIQHAGVVLGFGGIAGHAFIGEPGTSNGYFSRIICAQDYSAVTAACMMVKTSVYWMVQGMSEELKVAFNDIDFCMKVRRLGLRIVYNPYARLYHYESKSRGLENTQEKIERFNREMALFLDKWGKEVREGDPYYNPNLTLDKADFSLKL